MTAPKNPEIIADEDLDNVQGAGSAPAKADGRKIIIAEEIETILKTHPSPTARRIAASTGDGSI